MRTIAIALQTEKGPNLKKMFTRKKLLCASTQHSNIWVIIVNKLITSETAHLARASNIMQYSFLPYLLYSQAFYYRIVGYPEKNLQGELALVTGGGGGLGRLLSLRLAKLGVDVIIWDINQEGKY